MNWLDFALIGWWILAAATLIPTAIHFTFRAPLARAQNAKSVAFAAFRGQKIDRYGGFEKPSPVAWTFGTYGTIIAYAVLFVGFIGFIWMHNWTRLLFLNLQLCIFLIGPLCLIAGLSSLFMRTASGLVPKLQRFGWFSFGLLVMASAGYWILADIVRPRLIVEGRIDTLRYLIGLWRTDFGNEYLISIKGVQYSATREVYLQLHVGDRIRAELGAVSKIIFSAEPLKR